MNLSLNFEGSKLYIYANQAQVVNSKSHYVI